MAISATGSIWKGEDELARLGGEFNQVFPQAGTFKYHCSIHPQMKGTITVTE